MVIKKAVSDYLISLIKAAVRDEMPIEKPDDVSWHDLFVLANYHQVEEMAFYSITKLNHKPDTEERAEWFSAHERNELIDILQCEEDKVIQKNIADAQIEILPMKGSVLKKYYPRTSFRQMADLDYLIEPGKIEEVAPIMKQLSYEADDVGSEDSHDVFAKKPYLEVEMHRRLLPPTEENHWHTDDIWERLEDSFDNRNIKKMTWTDYYLFHLLHFEKHYSMGGIGIKPVVDQYIIMKKLKDKIDFDEVNAILPKMNYVEFEKIVQGLADAWFDDGEMSEELEGPAEFIINSGAFGTFKEYQKFSVERYKREQGIKTKKGYFFRRMFMERERMEYIYPSLKKHRWLLPFCWIHRLFKSVFGNWGRVKMELDDFKKN